METFPNDDWFDKVMLFLSKWSRPFADEWFKLMQWLLVISALSFVTQQNKSPILYVVVGISFVALWLHMLIGYHALWLKKSEESNHETSLSLRALLKKFLIWATGSLLITACSALILGLAWEFATKLGEILNP